MGGHTTVTSSRMLRLADRTHAHGPRQQHDSCSAGSLRMRSHRSRSLRWRCAPTRHFVLQKRPSERSGVNGRRQRSCSQTRDKLLATGVGRPVVTASSVLRVARLGRVIVHPAIRGNRASCTARAPYRTRGIRADTATVDRTAHSRHRRSAAERRERAQLQRERSHERRVGRRPALARASIVACCSPSTRPTRCE